MENMFPGRIWRLSLHALWCMGEHVDHVDGHRMVVWGDIRAHDLGMSLQLCACGVLCTATGRPSLPLADLARFFASYCEHAGCILIAVLGGGVGGGVGWGGGVYHIHEHLNLSSLNLGFPFLWFFILFSRKGGHISSKHSQNSWPLPAHGPCSWPLLMAPAHGPCSWPLLMAPAHGPCSWPLLMAPAHGPCSWPLLMAPAHGPCSSADSLVSVHCVLNVWRSTM